jgi:hypothetical protein
MDKEVAENANITQGKLLDFSNLAIWNWKGSWGTLVQSLHYTNEIKVSKI